MFGSVFGSLCVAGLCLTDVGTLIGPPVRYIIYTLSYIHYDFLLILLLLYIEGTVKPLEWKLRFTMVYNGWYMVLGFGFWVLGTRFWVLENKAIVMYQQRIEGIVKPALTI